MSSGSRALLRQYGFRKKWACKLIPFIAGLKNTKERLNKQERAGICRLNSFNRVAVLYDIFQKPQKDLYDTVLRLCEKISVNSKTVIKTLLSERLYSAAQIFLQYTMDTVICQGSLDINLLEWSAAEWNQADIRRISPACQGT